MIILKSDFMKMTKIDRKNTVNSLMEFSKPNYSFFFMLSLSVAIVSIGLLIDNITVLIGGMLIAPLLYPIFSLSMGIVMADPKLIKRSFIVIMEAVALTVMISLLVGFLGFAKGSEAVILNRQFPHLPYFLIALFSGLAASYALANPKVSEVLPGVAIAVALVPPLSLLGIGISILNSTLVRDALAMVCFNLFGLVFASLTVFSLLGFYEQRKDAAKMIKKEEKEIEKQQVAGQKENLEAVEKKIEEVKKIIEKEKNK